MPPDSPATAAGLEKVAADNREANQKDLAGIEGLIRGLGSSMASGFQSVGERMDRHEEAVNLRIERLEDRQTTLERQRAGTSDRVRSLASATSSADLSQAAELQKEREARELLDQKVDKLTSVLGRVEQFTKNPNVRFIIQTIALAAGMWAGAHGLK